MTVAAGTHGRPIYASVVEWRAEATRRFGDAPGEWRFVCPACGHEASCNDFRKLGADGDRAVMSCIGRVLNELGRNDEVYHEPPEPEIVLDEDGEVIVDPTQRPSGPSRRESGLPCNWSAGGLLGTLNEGSVIMDGVGKQIWVFDFAEVKGDDHHQQP